MSKAGLTAQPKKLRRDQKETKEGKSTQSLVNRPLGILMMSLPVFFPSWARSNIQHSYMQ